MPNEIIIETSDLNLCRELTAEKLQGLTVRSRSFNCDSLGAVSGSQLATVIITAASVEAVRLLGSWLKGYLQTKNPKEARVNGINVANNYEQITNVVYNIYMNATQNKETDQKSE